MTDEAFIDRSIHRATVLSQHTEGFFSLKEDENDRRDVAMWRPRLSADLDGPSWVMFQIEGLE